MAAQLKSVRKAAEELGVCKATLYAQVQARKIPHHKIGDRILIDVEEVINASKIEPESK